MKPNDKFEEILRRKLEQIQPQFQESDWGKFRTYQKLHIPAPSFWSQFGSSIMYSAAGLVATVLVVTNFYQYQKNQQLDDQLTQLKGKLAEVVAVPTTATPRPPDTVYVNRYITVPTPNHSQTNQPAFETPVSPKAYESEQVTQNQEITKEYNSLTTPRNESTIEGERVEKSVRPSSASNKGQITPTTEPTPETRKANNTPTFETPKRTDNDRVASEITSGAVRNRRQKVVQTTRQNQGLSKGTRAETSGADVGNGVRQVVDYQTNQKATPIFSTAEEAVQETSLSLISELEVAPLSPNREPVELASIEPAEIKVKRYAHLAAVSETAREMRTTEATTKPKLTPPPPSISFKNVKFRAGLGFNIGDKYTAISANTSLLLGKYWSLDVGIKRSHITGPQFFTEDLFREKVQKDFRDWRKDKDHNVTKPPFAVPQILNIQTDVELIRMPVTLTYRWPLREGFTILASAGTNLNLSAKQNYSYQIRKINGEFEEEDGDFDLNPKLNNDMMFGFGLEKQWRHLVAQVETYTAPYITKPNYLTENRNIGVRLKLLYQFGKN